MNWELLVTGGVGVWGAALSTYTAVARRNEKRRGIKVRFVVVYPTGAGGIGPAHFSVEAANAGDRTTTLTGVGIALPRDKNIYVLRPQMVSFPCDLRSGQSVSELIVESEVRSQLRNEGFSGTVRLRGFYDDVFGAKHLSKPKTIEL